MSYTISVTNSDTITIATGETDTSTSLVLVGKNVPNYGQIINQNLVNLMQNFAGAGVPNGPVDGQLWFDTSVSGLKVYSGNRFRLLSSITTGAVQPVSNLTGDFWWDSANNLLKIYDGAAWVAIGPYVLNTNSAVIPDSIIDSDNFARSVLRVVIDNITVGIISRLSFVPKVSVLGYDRINAGFNFANNTLVQNNLVTGNLESRRANISSLAANTFTASTITAASIGNSSSNITGTLTTAIQPNITSVGTLSSLTVSGNINSADSINSVAVVGNTANFTTINVGTIVAANVVGSVITGAQTSITAIGTLSNLGVTGDSTLTRVTAERVSSANIGNVGTTLTGTISTASQPNITSVGTLTALVVNGSANLGPITAQTVAASTIGNTGASLVGTIATASQTNITQVGTLSTLSVSGNSSVNNLNSSGTITQGNQPVLHAGNYNIYAPALIGTGATGNWNINITGNAAQAISAVPASVLAKTTAKAWVCFDGTDTGGTASIYSAYNVSSVTNVSCWQKRINLATPMNDINYAIVAMGTTSNPYYGNWRWGGGSVNEDFSSNFLRTTNSFQIVLDDYYYRWWYYYGFNNNQYVSVIVFGN